MDQKIANYAQGDINIDKQNIYNYPPNQDTPQPNPHNLSNSNIPKFVGRNQELIDLKTQLQQSQKLAISTLTGMGGIGKTELARQFGWQQWREKAYLGGICWLNVATRQPVDIGTSILDFARVHLKLTLPDEGELDIKIRYCWQNWLAGNVLIIFDDVRDYQQIKDYLPPQEEKRFQVLITTRKEYLSATIATFRVEVLKEEDALDLLRSYLENNRIDTQIEEAKLLCQDLGYLPLGLELVARLLKRRQDWKISRKRLIRAKFSQKYQVSCRNDSRKRVESCL